MPHVRMVDGLYLGAECLYRTPNTDGDVQRALGRLVAESVDHSRSADGLWAYPRCHHFGTLLDALTVIASQPDTLVDVVEGGRAEPSVTQTLESLTVVVTAEWTSRRLVHDPCHSPCANANEPVVGVAQDVTFTLAVHSPSLMASVQPVCAPPNRWTVVVDTPSHYLALWRGTGTGVYRYHGGVLWGYEWNAAERVLVDACHVTPCPLPEQLTTPQMDRISEVIVHADRMSGVVSSTILCDLLTTIADRVHQPVRWNFVHEQEMVTLLRRSSTPLCVARLIDPQFVLSQRVVDETVNIRGMSILRRMQTHGPTRDVDWAATMASEFAVRRFEVIPISAVRFAALHSVGYFDDINVTSCEHGIMIGEGMRDVILPMKPKNSLITHACACLLKCDVAMDDERETTMTVAMGTLNTEGSVMCSPDEELPLYRVHLHVTESARTSTVVLTHDSTQDKLSSRNARSVDALFECTPGRRPERVRRSDLQRMFPQLFHRLNLYVNDAFRACVREVQCRRVAQEWSLEGIDTWTNLSSLGMSLLLAITLSTWCGHRVRVALSRTRAAMVAVDTHDDTFELFDPTRTLCNFFGASDYLQRVPIVREEIRKGMVLEVRVGVKWYTVVVQSINHARGQFGVRFVHSGQRQDFSVHSHTWRRVSDDTSDLDRLVRRLTSDTPGEKRPRT